jgi:hypothetical protein
VRKGRGLARARPGDDEEGRVAMQRRGALLIVQIFEDLLECGSTSVGLVRGQLLPPMGMSLHVKGYMALRTVSERHEQSPDRSENGDSGGDEIADGEGGE